MNEPKHTTREDFFNMKNWSVSKKGNTYIRDHGHTYTIKNYSIIDPFSVVCVRFDGERKDFGPYDNVDEMIDELWPDGESAPKGVP